MKIVTLFQRDTKILSHASNVKCNHVTKIQNHTYCTGSRGVRITQWDALCFKFLGERVAIRNIIGMKSCVTSDIQ
jgi:hypothetical protein